MIVNNDKMIKFKENLKPTKEENLIMTPQNLERFSQLKTSNKGGCILFYYEEQSVVIDPIKFDNIVKRFGGSIAGYEFRENEFRMIDFFENDNLSLYQQFKLCQLLIANYSKQLKAQHNQQFCFYTFVDEEDNIVNLRFHTYRDNQVYKDKLGMDAYNMPVCYEII